MRASRLLVDGIGAEYVKIEKHLAIANVQDVDQFNISGRGPAAGAVGGGSPGSSNPAGNRAAGTGNPRLNAFGIGALGNRINVPGIPQSTTVGGGDVIRSKFEHFDSPSHSCGKLNCA